MANPNRTEVTNAVLQAATQFAEIDFDCDLLNQEIVPHASSLIEALVNMLIIVYYQVETGHASINEFNAAKIKLRKSLNV